MAASRNPAEEAKASSLRQENPDYADRDSPRSDDRGGESREFSNREWEEANRPTDPERRREFRAKWASTHLPNLPKRAGVHRCWVSTSHPTDTPSRRLAVGYRYVKEDEVRAQGWMPEQTSVKDGKHEPGTVRWREMVAMECDEELYQRYMREFHHDMPRDMVRDIYEPLSEMSDRIREQGGRVEMGDGVKEMVRYQRPPKQFE